MKKVALQEELSSLEGEQFIGILLFCRPLIIVMMARSVMIQVISLKEMAAAL